jgi:hypothetical protein
VKTRQEISGKTGFAAPPADAVAFRGLDPAEQHQNDNDDQNRADETNASMTETVSIATEAAAETAEQKDDQNNYKNKSQRHGFISICVRERKSPLRDKRT